MTEGQVFMEFMSFSWISYSIYFAGNWHWRPLTNAWVKWSSPSPGPPWMRLGIPPTRMPLAPYLVPVKMTDQPPPKCTSQPPNFLCPISRRMPKRWPNQHPPLHDLMPWFKHRFLSPMNCYCWMLGFLATIMTNWSFYSWYMTILTTLCLFEDFFSLFVWVNELAVDLS